MPIAFENIQAAFEDYTASTPHDPAGAEYTRRNLETANQQFDGQWEAVPLPNLNRIVLPHHTHNARTLEVTRLTVLRAFAERRLLPQALRPAVQALLHSRQSDSDTECLVDPEGSTVIEAATRLLSADYASTHPACWQQTEAGQQTGGPIFLSRQPLDTLPTVNLIHLARSILITWTAYTAWWHVAL